MYISYPEWMQRQNIQMQKELLELAKQFPYDLQSICSTCKLLGNDIEKTKEHLKNCVNGSIDILPDLTPLT